MRLVGRLLAVGRALARIGDRQARHDHQHFAQAPERVRGQHHPGQPRVQWELRQRAADRRQPATRVGRVGPEGAQFLQQPHAVGHGPGVRPFDEREVGHLAQPERRHLQDHRREPGPEDLRVGERGPGEIVVLAVEPDADAVRDTPAPPCALVGGRLGDRLDRQSLHLEPSAVPRDARGARVDHVADAGDGDRGLRHVGGEHDPTPGVGGEHPMLLGGRQAGVERQHVGGRHRHRLDRVGGVADLTLAGAEDEDVAGAVATQLVDGVADGGDLITRLVAGVGTEARGRVLPARRAGSAAAAGEPRPSDRPRRRRSRRRGGGDTAPRPDRCGRTPR